MADHEMTRGLPDVDAVVAVSCMAYDPFVLFVECIHGWPRERNPCPQLACVGGQFDVLPCCSGRALLSRPDGIPGCEPKVGMMVLVLGNLESVWRDVSLREISHRIVAWFEEQQDVLAISDPVSAEAHAHPPTRWLNVQQSLG